MSEPLRIVVRPNGPYVIDENAAVMIVDMQGTELKSSRPRIALCRCGGSSSKPFCDGTHAKIGFNDTAAAGETRAE